jgi:carboxylesterase
MLQIIPTAEPFFLPGKAGMPAVLLVHGFTGTPKEMRWLGEYLNRECGFTALGVRLTGHATEPEKMIHTNYSDWLGCVEDGYHLISGTMENIYLAGLSMGGVLSFTIAPELKIKGLISMSTPYKLPDDPRLRHIDALSRIVSFMPKSDEAPGNSWFDHEAFEGHVSYPQNPVRSIGELNKLFGKMHDSLPLIKIPVLLMHSHDDHYVLKDSMERIHADLTGTSDKEMIWLEKSGHVMTRDLQRKTVFKAAAGFIKRIEGLA